MFAGSVAGVLAVTVRHDAGVETTYSRLAQISVTTGQAVGEGTWLGFVGEAHAGRPGLHFGVKVDGEYVDPEAWLGPADASGAIHLAPLVWQASPSVGEPLRAILSAHDAGNHEPGCVAAAVRGSVATAPNDNIAVAVAGIGSKTAGGTDADMYEHGPEILGYPERHIYRFSYRGTADVDLHEPYERVDTYRDLRNAATRLGELLDGVAERHPGHGVDLIAHSQGGIVARRYLARSARAYDPDAARVQHLVTFSSPHDGAPLASVVDDLDRVAVGRALLDGVSRWARAGGPLPDPHAPAVAQLAPGSRLLRSLASEDVLFGTRVLTLGIVNDLVVPADRTFIDDEAGYVVPGAGLNGHSAIVASSWARAHAYDFLRDATPACRRGSDRWGTQVGRAVSFVEGRLGSLARAAVRLFPP